MKRRVVYPEPLRSELRQLAARARRLNETQRIDERNRICRLHDELVVAYIARAAAASA